MLAYSVIGAKDLDKSCAFYGGKQMMGLDRIKFYGTIADTDKWQRDSCALCS